MCIRDSFGLGYVFKNSKFELKITKYNKLVASVFLIIYVLISYYSQLNCNVEFHVYTNEFASPLYFIIMSILGIFIMIYFSRCFENSDNYVTRDVYKRQMLGCACADMPVGYVEPFK